MTTIDAIRSAASISTRAMLVCLKISTWSARKYDKVVTANVNAQYAVSRDAGRFNKCLLPGDAASYKRVLTVASTLRAAHYAQTLAWSDGIARLLPTANFTNYTTLVRDAKRDLDDALDVFVADYPALYMRAQTLLGSMFNADDYPKPTDVRDRFGISVDYMPVPTTDDIRVSLDPAQVSIIEASITSHVIDATKQATTDAWQRLHDCVSHIAERLRTPDAIFRDSLITNARELVDVMRRLNVTDDPALESIRARIETELTQASPDVLRDNVVARDSVAKSADDILAAMASIGYGSR